MKAGRQVAPKGCFHSPSLTPSPAQDWTTADLGHRYDACSGNRQVPACRNCISQSSWNSSQQSAPRHCQVQSGPGQQHPSLGWEIGAYARPQVLQPVQQETAMGEGSGAQGPASCPSTGSVPRGGSPEKAPGLSWAGQRDTHNQGCQFSTFHQH